MFKKYDYKEISNLVFELLNQKAVVIPTDTVIGLISKDINLIYEIKNRPKSKKIITFIHDYNQLGNLDQYQQKFVEKFWPGPVTVVKNGNSYRIPNDKYLLYLLSKVGTLYSSSANVSNHPPITNTLDTNIEFDEKKFFNKLVLVEGQTTSSMPSTVVDIDKWKILRMGQMLSEVQEFISYINQDQKSLYLLIDNELYSWAKTIKKSLNVNITIQRLNSKNFHHVLKDERFITNSADLLIVTKTPAIWDELANKTKGIRSGVIYNDEIAELSKKHDYVQIAIFDADMFDLDNIIHQIKIYLNTSFEGGRHQERIQTIIDYEQKN